MRTAHFALLLSLSAVLPAQAPKATPAKPIPDRALGLAKGSVFEVPAPPRYTDEVSSPGEKPSPSRVNREAPPAIPHGVGDFLPITEKSNLCLDCHDTRAARKKGEPTPIPASHYVDLRRAPDRAGEKVAGARYLCTACHLRRTDARPLVENSYRP